MPGRATRESSQNDPDPWPGFCLLSGVVTPRRFFEALDGSAVRVGDDEWRLRVYGVIEAAGRRWVQLALDGRGQQVLTLKLDESQGPSQAVHVLSSWLSNPASESSHVPAHVG